jgi:putative transposase
VERLQGFKFELMPTSTQQRQMRQYAGNCRYVCRKDFLHKESTKIAKNHRVVIVEDLKVKNMSASAKGTIEKPGKNVRAKAGLNRSILDQGWGMFSVMLATKLAWAGGELITVAPQYTSQECPACHHVSPDNRRTQARFLCVECGYENNADHVGAINIRRAGYARIAWSSTSSEVGASDQELTEATQAVPA